ncbi:MAG TPA: hypothetical protein VGR11_02755, partial [Solirubrobacteraceae bacterium]|nr:hypothetical protein [Solirubrobacteraceae bacterium]
MAGLLVAPPGEPVLPVEPVPAPASSFAAVPPFVAAGGPGAGMIGMFCTPAGGFVVGMIGVPAVAGGVAGGVTPGPVAPGWM